jgi:hypothetical protein
MGIVEDAGMGYGKPEKKPDTAEEDDSGQPSEHGDSAGQRQQDTAQKSVEEKKPAPVRLVPRVRVDKEAVRRYVATHRISLERTCDPEGFVQGYVMKMDGGETCGAKAGSEALLQV